MNGKGPYGDIEALDIVGDNDVGCTFLSIKAGRCYWLIESLDASNLARCLTI